MTYRVPPLAIREERRTIPHGARGIEATVAVMAQEARAGARDPLLADLSARIVQHSRTPSESARAIRAWIAGHTRFLPDPPDLELIRSPRLLALEIARSGLGEGDCDDVATLAAALGLAAGLPTGFALYGFAPGREYEHVFTVFHTEDGAVEIDTTRPAQLPAGTLIHRLGYRSLQHGPLPRSLPR